MATVEQLKAKFKATVDVIEALPSKERQSAPTTAFATAFNKDRRLLLELMPELTEVFPAEIEFVEIFGGGQLARATYAEILIYSKQFVSLLSN